MTSLLVKAALATALTVATIAGLIGISGSIIFADLRAPERAAVTPAPEENASTGAPQPMSVLGPR